MNYKKYNDYELVYMVRENDDYSQDIIFKKYEPLLKKIAREYYTKYKEFGYDYEDFYQEAMIIFQKALLTYNEDKNIIFYTYVVACVKKGLSSFCRNILHNRNSVHLSKCLDTSDVVVSVDDNASKNIDYLQFESICKDVIYSLNSEASAIMELKLNGFTYKEIGVLLDIPSSTVEYKGRKGRKLLREELSKLYTK